MKRNEMKKIKEQNRNRIIKDYDNNHNNNNNNRQTKMIYLYILQKMCFLQIFGTKTKAKNKATFGNIEYNSRDICTDSKCFLHLNIFF